MFFVCFIFLSPFLTYFNCLFRATLPMATSHEQEVEVEDRTATLTLDGAAEADQWLRDNGNIPIIDRLILLIGHFCFNLFF